MLKFASLCILAYKRPDQLKQCLLSMSSTAKYPHEIIVNLDGGDEDNGQTLFNELRREKISKLILNGGKNRGVGVSFRQCVAIAEGSYIVKIDTDLVFKHNWLTDSIAILEQNPDIGSLSLFNYNNYDPNDTRFKILETREHCHIVNDFVSSIYIFRSSDIGKVQPIQDDGNHTRLGKLAITKMDYVTNSGFGIGKSVYVSGTMDHPYKTPTFDEPLLLQ